MSGLIEDPRTLKQLVAAGFGHHKTGAAIISSTLA
jgi:hypothetical protein